MTSFYTIHTPWMEFTFPMGRVWTFSIVFYLILAAARWFIFKKAGEKGWKALIPIYSEYISFRLFWDVKLFWASFAVYMRMIFKEIGLIILALIFIIAIPAFISVLSSSVILAAYVTALVVIIFTGIVLEMQVCAVVYIIFHIRLMHRMSRSFGHGVPFTLGIVFLRPIFYFIMAFDSSVYTKIEE